MDTSTLTIDTTALLVAEQAYNAARAARDASGHKDLPEWKEVGDGKKIALSNAARAAIDGRPVWDVWSLSVGETPSDATQVLWRQKAAPLQLIPRVFAAVGDAIRAVQGSGADVSAGEPSILEDVAPETTPAPEEPEDVSEDAEE